MFDLVDYIKQKKANQKSLKDSWLDLSEENPYSQFLMTVMGGVNQLERDLIRMRQRVCDLLSYKLLCDCLPFQ